MPEWLALQTSDEGCLGSNLVGCGIYHKPMANISVVRSPSLSPLLPTNKMEILLKNV